MADKKESEFKTNVVNGIQHSSVKPYKDLCYDSDYRADENLTQEEYLARLEEVRRLQQDNEREKRERNERRYKELRDEMER